jgi:hypothetical protein
MFARSRKFNITTNRDQGMVPEAHELSFPVSDELAEHMRSADFKSDILDKLKDQHVVDAHLQEQQTEMADDKEQKVETLHLSFTRNNAGGLKDALDFLINHLVMHGLDTSTIRGALPRPKSDSFEDSLPFFESKLLQRAEPPVESTDSPTRSHFGDEERTPGMLDRLRKPGSMSSFTSIFNGRKNSNSPGSLFKHASSNASKASLASLESQGSSYRNPWNDSGINLTEDEHHTNGWPNGMSLPTPRFENKFPFGNTLAASGDVTPRYDPRASVDSGRPSTSHSASGYPAPIGPPR